MSPPLSPWVAGYRGFVVGAVAGLVAGLEGVVARLVESDKDARIGLRFFVQALVFLPLLFGILGTVLAWLDAFLWKWTPEGLARPGTWFLRAYVATGAVMAVWGYFARPGLFGHRAPSCEDGALNGLIMGLYLGPIAGLAALAAGIVVTVNRKPDAPTG